MAFCIFAVFLSIFGVVLFRYIDGSQCDNPFDKLYKDRNVKQLLEEVLGDSSWLDKMFSADSFTTAANDCKMNTSCRVELIFQYRNRMELCILSNKRRCFSLNCTCAKGPNEENGLNLGSREFECTRETTVMSNACDKREEQINTTGKTVNENHTTAIESNKQNNNCSNTGGNKKFDNIHTTMTGSNHQIEHKVLDENRFNPVPVTVAFILGTIVGSVVSIITIHVCRSSKLRQIQIHQQSNLCEDTPLHKKFLGETSEYSEIPEYSRNKLGSGFQKVEYLEPLEKKNTVSRETIPLENLYEKDESNQYHEVNLDRGNTVHNIYNHLQPNNGTNPQVSIKKDESSVDPLYHTLAIAELENKIDVSSDEHPCEAAPNWLNDNSPSNSDAKIKHIQKDEISSGRPYSMCKNTEQSTEIVETDEESEKINEQSNIDNTYFVLQKK